MYQGVLVVCYVCYGVLWCGGSMLWAMYIMLCWVLGWGEGNWIWTDGTPFNFTKWNSGEGAGGITQNCLALYTLSGHDERWYDRECFESYPFICEINLDYK